jgi:hypothetical protein
LQRKGISNECIEDSKYQKKTYRYFFLIIIEGCGLVKSVKIFLKFFNPKNIEKNSRQKGSNIYLKLIDIWETES